MLGIFPGVDHKHALGCSMTMTQIGSQSVYFRSSMKLIIAIRPVVLAWRNLVFTMTPPVEIK